MKIFSNVTMVQKICLLSLICLTIPSLLFSFYLYRRQADEFYSQLMHEQITAVEQATNNMDATLSSISQLVTDLAYSESLVKYLNRMHRTDLLRYPIWSERVLSDIIASFQYSLKYRNLGINSAGIYVPSSLPLEGNYLWHMDRLENLAFFQDFLDSTERSGLYFLNQEETEAFRSVCGYPAATAESELLILICRIEKDIFGGCLGYILFECSPRQIFSPLYALTPKDKSHYVWFSNSQKGYGRCPANDMEALLSLAQQSGSRYADLDGKRHICVSLPHFDITAIQTSPAPSYAHPLPALSLSLILACFALLQFVVLTLFIRSSFDQLHRDLNLMDAIIAHGFQEKIPETRTDEIGMIAHRYNILLEKISSLISENVRRQTAQTQAQLRALQYQINPHFIYNTLNIFSGYAAQSGQGALAESIASFGQLLRYTIKNDGVYATMETELRNAVSLINVYNIRYFDRLHLSIDVPQELKEFSIIKFLLQPILENAILHGLLRPDTSLHIHLAARQDEAFVSIEISDDGEGMSPQRLEWVKEYMEDPAENDQPISARSTFIGLKNIYKRLKLFYGDQASLSILSREHHGTTVTILIPINPDQKGREKCIMY